MTYVIFINMNIRKIILEELNEYGLNYLKSLNDIEAHKKGRLITKIMSNSSEYTKEELEAMSISALYDIDED